MRVEVSGMVFCSAHLIAGHERCECLHGHNWRVSVSLEGEVDERGMVMDFLELKRMVEEECSRLDHRLLLPQRSEHMRISRQGERVEVEAAGKRYSFPAQDVLLLPLKEITAEEVAALIAERLRRRLPAGRLRRLEVRAEEAPGQSALCLREL
jgi:6-pyruvoyltetrahydropterin/6-carboxytetrahydropterin synthase